MGELCQFDHLPSEIMCMIVSYLNDEDMIALKFAYPPFFSQYRKINVREVFSFNSEKFEKVLHLHINPEIVTVLDLNFCYWLPKKEICDFAKHCRNLKELLVAYSNITIEDLTGILQETKQISKLSLSIHGQTHNSFWLAENSEFIHSNKLDNSSKECNGSGFWKNLIHKSHLNKCILSLCNVHSLELYMKQDPIILGTIMSMCSNVENLCLRLNLEEDKISFYEYCKTKGNTSEDLNLKALEEMNYADQISLPKLKSIVLVPSRSCCTTAHANRIERFIQTIIEQKSGFLQSFWTSIPSCTVTYAPLNIKDMIAWKENKSLEMLAAHPMPAMESLSSNKYMEKGDFMDSRLKQIECGFWRDNFKDFCLLHPFLERVRLNKRPCEVSELYSIIKWYPLPRLRVLSLHSRTIYASDYLQNSWNRNRAERSLCSLLKAFPSLEELEICPDFNEKPESLIRSMKDNFITADSLCGLPLCLNLKKFHMNSVTISYKRHEVSDTSFLEELATNCPNLEAFSIQDLDINILQRGLMERNRSMLDILYNDCIERCCLKLRSARKLRFLRLKIRVVSRSFDQLIRLLAYCPSLIQLGLVATSIRIKLDMYSWDEKTFTKFFADLVEQLPKLVALLVVLPEAPISHCRAATVALQALFQPTRPCFCVQITDSLDSSDPPHLPWVHYQALACDPPPCVGELPFHLMTPSSRF